jgi:hypothetical protein
MNSLEKLLNFLVKLTESGIHYTLVGTPPREEAIMVEVAVPGELWEVEFFADGEVEVEVFRSDGGIEGEEALDRLFREFSD